MTDVMQNKNNNLHLAIDPSSNCVGISVWEATGKFITSAQIVAPESPFVSTRLYFLHKKFNDWFNVNFPGSFVTLVVIERISQRQASYALLYSAGALLSMSFIKARVGVKEQVVPPVWKKYVRLAGSSMQDPKGVLALKGVGWKTGIDKMSEDEADSIMLYLGWRAHNKMQVNWKQ